MDVDAPNDPRRRWTAADYVLYGRYCEPEVIAEALDRLRRRVGADAALLAAHRGNVLFHSLLLLSHRDARIGTELQRRLLERPRWPANQDLPFDNSAGVESLRARLANQPPFERVPEVLGVQSLLAFGRRGEDHESDEVAPTASIHLLLTGLAAADEQDLAYELDELLLMVNASAPVVVHGSLFVQKRADSRLDSVAASAGAAEVDDEGIDDPQALRAIAQALLDEALQLTQSSLGNIYFADRDGEYLRLVAQARNTERRESIRMDDPDSVVAWVYRRRRPMVINDISDFQRLHPSGGPIDVSGGQTPPYAELAVPVVQHSLAAGGSTVIGVVNVEKLQLVDQGRFTYRDLTLLHSVASRLALWRAHAMLRYTAASLAGLTRRNAAPAEIPSPERGVARPDPRVPADAHLARPIIDDTLHRIYSLTRSHSATVRLLSPDRQWLMRFSAYPPERLHDPGHDIHIDNPRSMVAWVAREGRACHLTRVKSKSELDRYKGLGGQLSVREGTRSELCLPIFVSGRLVGALNLESRFKDGYVDSVETAAAIAEQVGLSLQFARRSHEQAVLSMSTASTASVHELAKAVDGLRALASEQRVQGALGEELKRIAAHIARCIHSGADQVEPPRTALSRLLEEVLAELRLSDVVVIRGEPRRDVNLRAGDAQSLRVALAALFDNAKSNLHNSQPLLEVRWREHTVGGRGYVTMLIANSISMPRSAETLRLLYRQPLKGEGSDRVHIGAFTAAALVRSIGGDVFVRRSDPPRFVVGVDVPCPPGDSQFDEEG
jgi:GAF domain-containing protein